MAAPAGGAAPVGAENGGVVGGGVVITGGGDAGTPASGYTGGACKLPCGMPMVGGGGKGVVVTTGGGVVVTAGGGAMGAADPRTVVPGGGTTIVPGGGGGGVVTAAGVCPGQTRIRCPEGSIRGPFQLAQPGIANAQATTTSEWIEDRHFLRGIIN